MTQASDFRSQAPPALGTVWTVHRFLHWFFRVESWIALAGGALLLGYGGYLGVGIWSGGIAVPLGSDLPKGAVAAVILGGFVLAFAVLSHRAARSLRDSGAFERPAPAFAASVFCHIGLLMGIGAAVAA